MNEEKLKNAEAILLIKSFAKRIEELEKFKEEILKEVACLKSEIRM